MKKEEVIRLLLSGKIKPNKISRGLMRDKEVALEVVRLNGLLLDNAAELSGDKEVVMAAVKQNGAAITYVSEELRADKEVVMAAVKQYGMALELASEELRADREVALAAVNKDGLALQFVSNELRGDRDFVLKSVKQNGMAIKYASEEFRGDREVVMAAVMEHGYAFKYIGDEFRSDKEVALAAVNYVWIYASFNKVMQKDVDVIASVKGRFNDLGLSIDDYLCDELKELKKKYGADTLEMALEIEVAEMEKNRLTGNFKESDNSSFSVNIRL